MEDKLILFVDDNFYSKLELWEGLGDTFTIHTLTNGIEAYKWLSEGNIPDVIICEYYLPGYSGINLLEKVRKNPYLKNIPFIFVCERNFEKNLVRSRELGANDIYEKPIDYSRLRTRIETLTALTAERNRALLRNKKKDIQIIKFAEPVLAVMLLALLSPVFLLAMILIKLDSPGPVFEVKTKIGKGYRKIKDYKFRVRKWQQIWDSKPLNLSTQFAYKNIHCPECEKSGMFCSPLLYIDGMSICENVYRSNKAESLEKTTENKELTRIGIVLKKTKVRYLPNLINVVTGDMSFFGTVALAPNVAERYTNDFDLPKLLMPVGVFKPSQEDKIAC